MILKIWDNGGNTVDRYTVRIRNDYYFMSDNANMPNGVCMYAGEHGKFNEPPKKELICDSARNYKALPEGLRKQIANLA